MLQELLPLLPKEASTLAIIIALAGAAAGLALWLAGARFSRSLITLLAVAVGALVGLCLPEWFGWGIDGWATAVGGALVFGILGYVLHGAWVGVGLGAILAIWASLATMIIQKVSQSWSTPFVAPRDGIAGLIKAYWMELPTPTQHVLPFVCAGAMTLGILAAIVRPRAAMVMLYSLTGVLLMVGMGAASVKLLAPNYLKYLPARVIWQMLALIGLVLIGALFQLRLAPERKPKPQVQVS